MKHYFFSQLKLPDNSISNKLTIDANYSKKSTIFTYPVFTSNNKFEQPFKSNGENKPYHIYRKF